MYLIVSSSSSFFSNYWRQGATHELKTQLSLVITSSRNSLDFPVIPHILPSYNTDLCCVILQFEPIFSTRVVSPGTSSILLTSVCTVLSTELGT